MRVEYTRDFAVILLVWVAMVALVNPMGDFPLNDDWSYARPVHSLVNSGTLELLDWPAMTLISHVLWGALVSLLFGFSFMTLRVSTLLLAVLALFVFYKTLREVGANRSIARWGTFIIAANPLFLCLANTFMTDVPFFAVAMLSALFFIRALKHSRKSDLWIAVLLAVVATLIRQLGVFIPMAFAAAYIYRNGYSKKILVRACIPFVATLLVLIAFQIYLRQVQDIPAAFEEKTQVLLKRLTTEPRTVLDMILRSSAKSVIYLGLFLLPFTILFTRQKPFALERRESRLPMAGFAAVVALLGTFLIVTGKLLPMLQNMIYDFGLGPPTLRDVYILDLLHLPRAPRGLWLAVTIAGIIGGSAALIFTIQTVSRLFRRKIDIETRTRGAITLFVAGVGVLYFMPLSIIGVFDRYLLFCLPLAMLLWTNASTTIGIRDPWWLKSVSAVILIFFAAFAVGGTRDYMNWNRARWSALKELTEQRGIPPCSIDGGFEFNGWYCYDKHYSEVATRSWWWVEQDDYVITFGRIPGFVEEKRFPYTRWIPPGRGYILVLRKAIS